MHIVEGRFGPWLSGVVRPGTPDTTVYAARASRISGHWVGGKLKAIVSVNAEGFEVPGDPFAEELAAGFAFSLDEDGVGELVASFPSCFDGSPAEPTVSVNVAASEADVARIRDEVIAALRSQGVIVEGVPEAPAAPAEPTFDRAAILAALGDDD